MIPLSAPSILANVAKANGAAPSAATNGAEAASFAAMLGATESPAADAEGVAADTAAALVATLAGLPDGKSGKAGGKNLPDGEEPVADDLKINEAPDEADQDQADVPIAAAIPILPLNVPPLPGIGDPAEFRAAVPDNGSARATVPSPVASVAAQPAPTAPAAQQAVQEQAVTRTAVQEQVVTRTAVPAQVLSIELAPVVTVEAHSQVDRIPTGSTAVPSPLKVATADPRPQQQQLRNLIQDPLILSLSKDVEPGAASTSFDKLRTSGGDADSANSASSQLPGFRPTETAKALSLVNPANKAPPAAHLGEPGTTNAATPRVATAQGAPTAAAQPFPPVTASGTTTKADEAEPLSTPAIKDRPTLSGPELDHATHNTQPVPHQAHANSQPAAATRITDAPAAAGPTQSATEQPHDFATLVDRLSQAREAASPQVVRTALQHAEFGRVSLQFRHDDASLSVTLANTDPAFNSAVHSAVAASLAGNGAGNSDQSRSDGQQHQQHQQQYQPASQQQSGTSGSGSQGQQQSAQARSEQAERMFQRAQGSSPRAEQGETASSGRADSNARRSGIYA